MIVYFRKGQSWMKRKRISRAGQSHGSRGRRKGGGLHTWLSSPAGQGLGGARGGRCRPRPAHISSTRLSIPLPEASLLVPVVILVLCLHTSSPVPGSWTPGLGSLATPYLGSTTSSSCLGWVFSDFPGAAGECSCEAVSTPAASWAGRQCLPK